MELRMAYPGFLMKAFTLSYDDGVASDVQLIHILKRYNVKGTFNLNSGLFSQDGKYIRRLSLLEAEELYNDSNIEVAAHSLTHPHLELLDELTALGEILTDKLNLEKIFNKDVVGFAYPYGNYSDEVIAILKRIGIIYARTTESYLDFRIPEDFLKMGATCHHKNERLFDLAYKFVDLKPSECQLLYVWGHSYEFYHEDNFSRMEELLQIVGNKDDIWYATNREIVEYVNAYRALNVVVKTGIIENNSNKDIYLFLDNKKVILRANSKIEIE